jgi:hypothetical protein
MLHATKKSINQAINEEQFLAETFLLTESSWTFLHSRRLVSLLGFLIDNRRKQRSIARGKRKTHIHSQGWEEEREKGKKRRAKLTAKTRRRGEVAGTPRWTIIADAKEEERGRIANQTRSLRWSCAKFLARRNNSQGTGLSRPPRRIFSHSRPRKTNL